MTDKERFLKLLSLPASEVMVSCGVGTLGEKYLHALLKLFFEPDKEFREVRVGRYTADICRDATITEIQTRSLDKLREKLDYYLLQGYKVRVVLPLPHVKRISWIDPKTGEATGWRASWKKGCFYDCFWELYKIKSFLNREGVSVCLMLIDVQETRWLNGCGRSRKKRSTRIERVPTELYDILNLESPNDYSALVPKSLSHRFTAQEYAEFAGISRERAWSGIKILCEAGVIRQDGKDGRKNLYARTFDF